MITADTIKKVLFYKKIRTVIKLLIPFSILFYLFYTLDLTEIKTHILHINSWLFLFSFVLLCLKNILGAYRSSILLKYKKFYYSLLSLTKYYFIGNFFNLFLPEIIGRDFARGFYLYRTSSGKKETISSIVVERFIGTAALMLLSILSVVVASLIHIDILKSDTIRIIVSMFVFTFLFLILLFHEKTEQAIERLTSTVAGTGLKSILTFIHDMIEYYKAPMVLLYTFLISLVFQFSGVISTYLVALSLACTTKFIYFVVFLPIIWIAGMLPVSVNGLGVREGSFVFLFMTAGMEKEMAMAICILWFVQNIGLGVIGAVLFYLEGNSLSKLHQYREAAVEK
ncbi:MAG TPA: lysylphosphatidylglycerol synthase transmembrane domain-containing protein [Anaerolineae bacterium]|nr:lysylphosphatidylglycerol synthase transmembrane domain-containing protein [Anaerolineae bacterium]